jgi:hypothetical protein
VPLSCPRNMPRPRNLPPRTCQGRANPRGVIRDGWDALRSYRLSRSLRSLSRCARAASRAQATRTWRFILRGDSPAFKKCATNRSDGSQSTLVQKSCLHRVGSPSRLPAPRHAPRSSIDPPRCQRTGGPRRRRGSVRRQIFRSSWFLWVPSYLQPSQPSPPRWRGG